MEIDPIGDKATRSDQSNPVGLSRRWGDAPKEVKETVRSIILKESKQLSTEDQALLLAIAHLESGFNPSAKAPTTSAAGVFQIVKKTGLALGLLPEERYDATLNIRAGIELFRENAARVKRRGKDLTREERAVAIYALHHDGPSLVYGGEKIARERLLPLFKSYLKQAE